MMHCPLAAGVISHWRATKWRELLLAASPCARRRYLHTQSDRFAALHYSIPKTHSLADYCSRNGLNYSTIRRDRTPQFFNDKL